MSAATPMPMEPMMTGQEVADLLGVSLQEVYRRAAARSLPGVRIGTKWRFQPDAIRRLAFGDSAAAEEPPRTVVRLVPAEPVKPEGVPVLSPLFACECCWWAAPLVRGARNITQEHHVVPRHAGGSDEESNLVRLCPNCHVMAHELIYRVGQEAQWPTTRRELLAALADLYGRAWT